jgi:hypothetical protein
VLKEWGLDADALIREACYRRGVFIGEKMGDVKTPSEFLKKLSSKTGVLAWEQEFTILNDERAAKELYYCPHMVAIEEAGATKEEMVLLCKNICHVDQVEPYPVNLRDSPTIGEEAKMYYDVDSKEKKEKIVF